MSFTDEDLKRLKDGLNGNPAAVQDFEPGWLLALISRLEASEEIAKGFEAAHPEDENCACSMCDLLKAWRKAAGK